MPLNPDEWVKIRKTLELMRHNLFNDSSGSNYKSIALTDVIDLLDLYREQVVVKRSDVSVRS